MTTEQQGRVCLVTGANRGIGKAVAAGLAQAGAQVVMVVRNEASGKAALAEIATMPQVEASQLELLVADLSSQVEVRRLAADFKERHAGLHVLVHNAGVAKRQRSLSADGVEMTLAVNHLAPFLLTDLLLVALKAGAPSRVIVTSSLVHKWGRIDFDNLQGQRRYDIDTAYNQSKLANVLFTYELARRLEGSGITANSYEPGMTATEFGREYDGFKAFMSKAWRRFMVSPEKAAETAIYLATSPEVAGISGKHFIHCEQRPSSKESHDEALARRFWDVSAELVGM